MDDKKIKIYRVNGINVDYLYDIDVMTDLDSLCMDVREFFAREYYWKCFGEYEDETGLYEFEKFWNKHLESTKNMDDEELLVKCLAYNGVGNAVILPTAFFMMFTDVEFDDFELGEEVTDWFIETVKRKINLEHIKTYVVGHTQDEIAKEFYHGACGEISDFWSF